MALLVSLAGAGQRVPRVAVGAAHGRRAAAGAARPRGQGLLAARARCRHAPQQYAALTAQVLAILREPHVHLLEQQFWTFIQVNPLVHTFFK